MQNFEAVWCGTNLLQSSVVKTSLSIFVIWAAKNSDRSMMLRDSSEDDLGRMPEWLRGSSQDAARKLMGSNPIPTMRFPLLLLQACCLHQSCMRD